MGNYFAWKGLKFLLNNLLHSTIKVSLSKAVTIIIIIIIIIIIVTIIIMIIKTIITVRSDPVNYQY